MLPATEQQTKRKRDSQAGEASSGCDDMTIKSLDDVASKLSSDCDESAAALRNAVQTLQRGVQAEIRNLCKPWGVQLTEKNSNGNYSKRADAVLKSELKDKFIAKAKEHLRAKATENQPLQHALTEHTTAIQLKKGTEAPASSAATEHAETEFHIDEALAETLRSLQALGTQRPIWTRVIDHACSSEHCMSYRLVAMLRLAHWNISADLCNDQPLDACGYIAADAVCRLRDAALSEANSWHDIPLPDYAQVECISRGNKVLRKKGDQRILETDEVNCLVRHYSHLDQRRQAAEEWWAGAVALDHFLTGLPIGVEEITTTGPHTQHQWRAWVVNTQTSRQPGSHWITVVVGTQQQHVGATPGSMLELSQPLQSLGTHADPITNNYANLFQSPDPDLSNALGWAHANAMHPHVAAWLHACSQWDSAVATKEHERQKKRRKLCKEHDIPCTKVVDTNNELETAMEYIRRQLTNRIKDIRAQPLLQSKATGPPSAHSIQQRAVSADTTLQPPRKKTEYGRDNKLDNYFKPRAAGDAPPDIEELRIPDVATDVSSTYLRLHAKRYIYAEDEDFCVVKDALSELRGFVHKKRLNKMTTDPPKIRQDFKERSFGTIAFNAVSYTHLRAHET